MKPAAVFEEEMESVSDECSLKRNEELIAKPALNADYALKTNRLRIPNKKILQVFLDISIDSALDESDQIELLEGLNTLNEF